MPSTGQRSSEHSNSTNRRRDYVFFTDRDCDGPIYRALVDAGLRVERHDDHFSPYRIVQDHEWIPLCSQNGWIGVTSDQRMRYNRLALMAVRQFGARILVNVGSANHPTKGANFVASLGLIYDFLDVTPAPFIARVYLRQEGVRPWWPER